MLQVSGLTKSFTSQLLFDKASFSLQPGERVGVVGRNGHGKSTLFKIIIGEMDYDEGDFGTPEGYTIGHLSQHLHFTKPTILEEASLGLTGEDAEWGLTHKAEEMLVGLGFSTEDFTRAPSEFSGGFQVRLNLAKLLLSNPNLLLLDEPTNYLDIISMRWLSRFLRAWPGEVMLITHDRAFMDEVCTHTMGIHRSKIRKVTGSTQNYFEQISLEEEIHEKTRQNQAKQRADVEAFITRFRAKASKAKAVQSRVKLLEKQEKLEALSEIKSLDFEFTPKDFPGKWIINVKDISFAYPNSKASLFSNLSFSIGKRDRIAVIGKNGIGKSTLLQLLAGGLKPTDGSIEPSSNMALAYFGQTNVDRLNKNATVEQEIASVLPQTARTVVRNICGLMMFEGDAALKHVSVLSGGERARVLLGKLLLTPANLLLLDEPSHHLDQFAAEALNDAVAAFPGAVVMVTHSEQVLREIATRLIIFDGGKITLFEGGYDDFLERIGWAEEQGNKPSSNSNGRLSKKELRKLRAEVNAKRAAVLTPLKNKLETLEKEIAERETKLEEARAKLIDITQTGFNDEASKLSRFIGQEAKALETLYEEMFPLSEEVEKLEKQFAEMLQGD